jgi:excisionase family DNA binding protein
MAGNSNLRKNLLNIGQASEYLGVSIDTLRRWEKKGRVEPLRSPGNHRYFLKEDLDKLFGKRYTHDESGKKTVKNESPATVAEKKEEPVPPAQTFAPINYPTLDTVEEISHFDRSVRDIKIPDVNLIRIIKTEEEARVPGNTWIQEAAEKTVTTTSILTPAALLQPKEEIKDGEKMNQAPKAEIQKSANTGKSNLKLYITLLGLFVILIAFVFFMIGATSQEILSPVP